MLSSHQYPTGSTALQTAVSCANPGCITNREPGSAERRFVLASLDPSRGVRCRYCDAVVRASIGEAPFVNDERSDTTKALLPGALLEYAPLGVAD